MASRGKNETEVLKNNLFSQLDRLIIQLHDCEQMKLVRYSIKYIECNLTLFY